ncbi:hypothetical protein RIF29_09772 [Crotalaria pallida]|uniref:ABC transporter domain-containing protein n=1 Tax=Crotalaria pallida TaxID=3830 RepID=A0AAN9FS44_CROPI
MPLSNTSLSCLLFPLLGLGQAIKQSKNLEWKLKLLAKQRKINPHLRLHLAAPLVRVCGSCAYVSQSEWIQSGNIEENILFGSPMDKAKYKNVLLACSMKKDLELFSHGDQTIIGDRGINLSGGQKQRVQLARALYQDVDIDLLDDPFNAVDAQWIRFV